MAAPRSINSFVYPCDNDIARLLDSAIVQSGLKKIADHYYSKQIKEAVSTGCLVTRNSFPSVYRIIEKCAASIEIPKEVQVVLTPKLRGVNALAVENEGKGVVFLSHAAVTKLEGPELSFVIGHEFGHIAQGNLSCHTIKGLIDNLKDTSEILGSFLSDMIDVPLNKWYQCSEYTADRAGLICCGQLSSALDILHKILPVLSDSPAINNYIELSSSHPFLYHRVIELKKYYQTLN